MTRLLRFRQLGQLIAALFREIIREPGVLFWGILFPILMSLGLGLAFAKKADVTRKVAVISGSEDHSEKNGTRVFDDFFQSSCERNISEEKEEWKWKYVITSGY
jgi:ABC-2 type transport system permease protein